MPQYYYHDGPDPLNAFPVKEGSGSLKFSVTFRGRETFPSVNAFSAPEEYQPYSLISEARAIELLGDSRYRRLPEDEIWLNVRIVDRTHAVRRFDLKARKVTWEISISEAISAPIPMLREPHSSRMLEISFYAISAPFVPRNYVHLSRGWLIQPQHFSYSNSIYLVAAVEADFCPA